MRWPFADETSADPEEKGYEKSELPGMGRNRRLNEIGSFPLWTLLPFEILWVQLSNKGGRIANINRTHLLLEPGKLEVSFDLTNVLVECQDLLF